MKEDLIKNFRFIQYKIDEIRLLPYIDIKKISDLERYIGMQKTIVEALRSLKEVEQ